MKNKKQFAEFLKTLGEASDTEVTKKVQQNVQKLWDLFQEKIPNLQDPYAAGCHTENGESFYEMLWVSEDRKIFAYLETSETKVHYFARFDDLREVGTVSIDEIETFYSMFGDVFSRLENQEKNN